MTKKFSNEQLVWIRYGVFQMQQGRLEAARNLLKRSLKSLSKQQRKYEMCITCVSHVYHMCITCVLHVYYMCMIYVDS